MGALSLWICRKWRLPRSFANKQPEFSSNGDLNARYQFQFPKSNKVRGRGGQDPFLHIALLCLCVSGVACLTPGSLQTVGTRNGNFKPADGFQIQKEKSYHTSAQPISPQSPGQIYKAKLSAVCL